MKKRDDIWPQLRSLRGMAEETGAIHDAQALQLKAWGWSVFQHVDYKAVKVLVDVEKRDVVYEVPASKKRPPIKRYAKLVAFLDASAREMMGDTWRLRVREGGKLVYSGRRAKEIAAEAEERRLEREKKSGEPGSA